MAANQTRVRPSRSALSADFEKQYAGGIAIRASFVLAADPPVTSILFGPSGAGKTTILRCIAGLDTITSGTIHFGDEVWSDTATRRSVPPQRRSLGYLFQDHALFPHLTVRDNVAFGLGGLDRADRNRHVEEACEKLGVEALLDRRPDQLSGGQGQRVALARVLVRRPGLLLLDEPFAALDDATRDEVRGYLCGFLRSLEIPALVVTHDWVDALALGDEMIVLDRGRILQTGTPHQVLTRPADREVAALAGVETVAEGRLESRSSGTAVLRVGSSELVALDPGANVTDFWISIRGEDVTLEEGIAHRSSARNHLTGRIVDIEPQAALMRVAVDVGFRLTALVTRQSAEDLNLVPGKPIAAAFKASKVHLIPRAGQAGDTPGRP